MRSSEVVVEVGGEDGFVGEEDGCETLLVGGEDEDGAVVSPPAFDAVPVDACDRDSIL